jgi:hypothetical protein
MHRVPSQAAPLLVAVSHFAPHEEQFAVVLRAVSHPSSTTGAFGRMQLPKPALHTGPQLETDPTTAHEVEVAFVSAQARPQSPQFVAVFSLVSQPLAFAPELSQSP